MPPGMPGRPATEKRRAFAVYPHDFVADEPGRHIGRASLPPPALDTDQGVSGEADGGAGVDEQRRAGAGAGVDDQGRVAARVRVVDQGGAGGGARVDDQGRAGRGAGVDDPGSVGAGARVGDRGRAQGRAPGLRPDRPLDRVGRPAAGALVELRRPRRPDERERDGSEGREQDRREPGRRGPDRHGQERDGQDARQPERHELDGDERERGGQGLREPERHELDCRQPDLCEQERDEEERGERASGGSGGGGLLRSAVPLLEAGLTGGTGAAEERPQGGGRGADRVRKKRLRQTALPVVAAGIAAFVVGTGYLAVSDRDGDSDLGRWGPQAVAAPVTVAGRSAGDPFGAAAVVAAGVPGRLRVKAIGIDTSLESLHLGTGGALVPPKVYGRAGWYSGGTAPGDVGPAVIAGHVDSKSGPAIFYRLRELTVGDRIEVVRGGSVVRFTVVRVAWYPKTRFPTGEVYGPTPDRQLRLITCGGVFDHRLRSYTDNLVVYAVAG
ncbi:sortase [Actinoplanes sp. NPDC051411]|uniref:sortase domain-containing protein n=1 Tax=Actinoplanes sp. NPDC051411 TaxID=3155522 RepID=UPI00341A7BA0